MDVRVIERISTYSPLGLRFWDQDFAKPVEDGMIATARPWQQPDARPRHAVRTFSGALSFHGLPGLRDLENNGPDAPLPSPPTRRFLIEVTDTKSRFAPAAFPVDLPLGYSGPYLGQPLPANPPPGFLLLSGPDRPREPMWARVRGELALASTGGPAAWAQVNLTDPEGRIWHGIADAGGRFAVVLPWPSLEEVAPGSPPTGAASSLTQRTWSLGMTVQAAPAGLTPITASGVPNYAEVLAQPAADIWPEAPGASPPAAPIPAINVTIAYGETTVLRSGSTQSRLFVGAPPAGSP